MTRPNRVHVEGGFYHVYNRLGRGERVFDLEQLVESSEYLDQLLAYIHLNPVAAGIVEDPAAYRWSGHLDLLGKTRGPIIDVDQVLRVFGRSRRAARAAYVRRLKGAVEEEWIGEVPGRLPWWRLGRPPKGEEIDPETAIRKRQKKEELGPEWRPEVNSSDFVFRGAECLGVEITDLRSSRRGKDLVRARELLAVSGVERYSLKVKEQASVLRKTPDGISQAIARGVRKRIEDACFRQGLDELDRRIAGTKGAR